MVKAELGCQMKRSSGQHYGRILSFLSYLYGDFVKPGPQGSLVNDGARSGNRIPGFTRTNLIGT